MLTYQALNGKPRKFVTFTSLTPGEFDRLLPAFARAYERKYPASKTKAGTSRQRKVGAGRQGSLASNEQKLLLGLVHQKSYALQSVMGELFGMGPSQANEWIHVLEPILKQALDDLGYASERAPRQFQKKERDGKAAADSMSDGTERRRQRPKQAEKQALHHRGKKKTHSDKNIVNATAKKKRGSFLGQTQPGKTHDKHAAETDKVSYPEHIRLHKDAGFQGDEPNVKKLFQPKKSRARKN